MVQTRIDKRLQYILFL